MTPNFILFHIGNDIPRHAIDCVNNILITNPGSKIYFISNAWIRGHEDVIWVNVNDFKCRDVLNTSFFHESGHAMLFRTSAFRFFFIDELIKTQGLKNNFHFDNDVLVYSNLSHLLPHFENHDISITPHSPHEYVCGMMYMKSHIDVITEYFSRIIHLNVQHLNEVAGKGFMPNEMRLLSILNSTTKCINLLPVLPFGEFSNEITMFESIFDPSSYGQHIGGTPDKPEGGWVCKENTHRVIDKLLVAGVINVEFINKKPFIRFGDDELYQLNNLHIHSKQTEKYRLAT